MKLPLVFASALTALLPALAPVTSPQGSSGNPDGEIAGVYECDGTRADGARYSGTVEIVRNNGTYRLMWSLGSREHYLGFGVVNDNVMAVSVFGGMPGVVAYRIERGEKGPRLIGQWAVPDASGQVFVETLTKLSNIAAPPRAPEPSRRPVILRDPRRT